MSLLSIVLPAYNEEQNIANTAKVLGELLEQHGIDYELVFISDGSKDGTFERIKEESARNPRTAEGIRGCHYYRLFYRHITKNRILPIPQKYWGNCWNSTGSIMSWYLSVMVRRTEPLNVLRKNRPGIREYGERSFPGISERKPEFLQAWS